MTRRPLLLSLLLLLALVAGQVERVAALGLLDRSGQVASHVPDESLATVLLASDDEAFAWFSGADDPETGLVVAAAKIPPVRAADRLGGGGAEAWPQSFAPVYWATAPPQDV